MLVLFNGLQAGNRSGTGTYTRQLARWLPEAAGIDLIEIVWPADIAPPLPTASATFLVRQPEGPVGRIRYDQFGFPREAAQRGAHLVHYPANVGCIRGRCNQIVSLHDLSFYRHPAWFGFERALYYRYAVSRSARRAAHLLTGSHAAAHDIQEFLGIPAERITVIPDGVDERFQPASDDAQAAVRVKHALPERFFLYVGTHEPRKNLDRLIRAWSSIAGACPLDLVLAGRSGWKTSPIRAEAARSPFTHRIHFPGFIDDADLPALMSAADAFVYPSLYEGFGIPVLEAMACGTPVLTSDAPSLPEVAGDAALLVAPEQDEAIAGGLSRLAGDDALCAALRAKGLARAAQYSWKRTAEATVAAYRKILGA
ncbi:MAG: glycosyltransferase family 4 protein [Candidatus Hydrogenedentes bacterium]|nr:glycosyltransferase family 4 protein [Candidatus Hydrogenedentota bacterium]